MVRTQIQLTEEQARELKTFSSSHHQSMAETIRQAVNSFIAERGGREEVEARKRALAASGKFSSGVSNLSEKHDDYLAEAFEN